jgi:2-oxoglutarate dehydrogenase E2 component (dihydrolipoamide succinyltransferase)
MLRRKSREISSCQNETAMLTTFNEVNMTPINLIRNEYKMRLKQNMVELV